jgi:hypothetical protein
MIHFPRERVVVAGQRNAGRSPRQELFKLNPMVMGQGGAVKELWRLFGEGDGLHEAKRFPDGP